MQNQAPRPAFVEGWGMPRCLARCRQHSVCKRPQRVLAPQGLQSTQAKMRVHHATEHRRYAVRLSVSKPRVMIDLVRAEQWVIVVQKPYVC